MIPSLEEKINAYTESVINRQIRNQIKCCARCGQVPESFRFHDQRKRSFLIVIDRLVKCLLSFMTRWQCPLCEKVFTFYPDFALPRKRYVRDSVLQFSRPYLEVDCLSYRKAVKVTRLPVFYDRLPTGEIDDRQLAHSTPCRWLTFFSGLKRTLQRALKLIREKSATSTIFRSALPIPPWKYRSAGRRIALQTALNFFFADDEYQELFQISITPRLATVLSWS